MSDLEWHNYKDQNSVPTDVPLLMELDTDCRKFQVGYFKKNNQGGVLGIVGGQFAFDFKILRWADLSPQLPKNEHALTLNKMDRF
jgi:hypothetical protein